MSESHIIDDVNTVLKGAQEQSSTTPAIKDAMASLSLVHRDLPKLVEQAGELLHATGVDTSGRLTAVRVADAFTREIVANDARETSEGQRLDMLRRGMRNVLVQEASSHMLRERDGGQAETNFFGHISDGSSGAQAIAALGRQRVAVRDALSPLSDNELRSASTGAYDRLGKEGLSRVANLLDMPTTRLVDAKEVELNRALAPREPARAVINPVHRHQPRNSPPPRQPSFGRKMANHHASQGQGM